MIYLYSVAPPKKNSSFLVNIPIFPIDPIRVIFVAEFVRVQIQIQLVVSTHLTNMLVKIG